MSKATKKSVQVESSIKVDNSQSDDSKVNSVFNSENPPTIRAVGCAQIPGSNQWVSHIVYIQGDKVIKVEAGVPNLRLIAEEEAKCNFVNLFMNGDIQE